MALTPAYFGLGTGIFNPGTGVSFEIAGLDFNPTQPSNLFGGSNLVTITNAAPTDLSQYRFGHEIVCAVARRINNTGATITSELKIAFSFPGGNTWTYSFGTWTLPPGSYYGGYAYAGIDFDEFTTNGTATFGILENNSVLAATNITYTGYDTSWNTTIEGSGALWVEGDNLYFIDNVYGDGIHGKKHRIDHDGSSTYVDSAKSGYIRFSDNSGDERYIYYIDEDGYRRRTYGADNRYGGPVNVGTSNGGKIRVNETTDAAYGYGYLCFVGSDGYKRRIMNGPV